MPFSPAYPPELHSGYSRPTDDRMTALTPNQEPHSSAPESATTVCRGVRGATTVEANTKEAILKATRQLLALIIRRNDIDPKDLASAIFTVTRDVNAEFPALAARQMGWLDVPLLCGYEVEVPGSLPLCVRILLHWNTNRPQQAIHHVYIHDAVALRPDLSKLPPVDWQELETWINSQMTNRAP